MGRNGGSMDVAATKHGTMKDLAIPILALQTDKDYLKEAEVEWKHTHARWKQRIFRG